MKTVSLQITYRKGKPFAAYIYLSHQHSQKSVRTEAVTEDLLIDYAQDGTPLGIEVRLSRNGKYRRNTARL